VTSASGIEKGKWLEWRDTPERTDSSGSNGPVEPDLDLDEEESFILGRLVSADVIEHETDHAPDYGDMVLLVVASHYLSMFPLFHVLYHVSCYLASCRLSAEC
jgi:hypothetical protein